ncbi:MAG: hypothetical protein QNJ55_17225 [Xenococcus sp. MO_188.B8]|nr:hypothetical protein [Xenococcus sp. MO_188.B8]
MAEESKDSKDSFLYPIGNYRGKFSPGNLAFSANLQIFAQRVSYLCALETNGKISPEDTYHEIKKFWEQLKQSKQEFLDNNQFDKGK